MALTTGVRSMWTGLLMSYLYHSETVDRWRVYLYLQKRWTKVEKSGEDAGIYDHQRTCN